MLRISKLFWLFVIFGFIHQLHCSEFESYEMKTERCLNKFNVTQTTRGNTTGLSNTVRNTCVDNCINFDLYKSKKLKIVGMTKLLCSSSFLENIPDDNQQMEVCFSKFDMTPTTRIGTNDFIAFLKIQCLAFCISPNIAESDEEKRQAKMFCSSFENTRENNEKFQMCQSKYNVSKQSSETSEDRIETVKTVCALTCVFPAFTKMMASDSKINETKLEQICEYFENTPENNQKLDTCFARYNASKTRGDFFSLRDPIDEEVKVSCAFKCISPLTVEPGFFLAIKRDEKRNKTELDQICQLVEMTPENSAKQQACFDKYLDSTSKPNIGDDVVRLKFKCAQLCYSPEIFEADWHFDEEREKLVESRCQSVEISTQNRRQVDDSNSKMENSL